MILYKIYLFLLTFNPFFCFISLTNLFYIDIFNINIDFNNLLFEFNFDLLFEQLYGYLFQYLGILSLLMIYFFLFKNIFLYSLQYYIIQLILSFQYNYWSTLWNILLQAIMVLFVSWKPYNLLTRIADNMFVSTIVVLNLTLFNNIFFCVPEMLYFLPDNYIQIYESTLNSILEEYKQLNSKNQFIIISEIVVNLYIEEFVQFILNTNDYDSNISFFEEKLFDIYIDNLIFDIYIDNLIFDIYIDNLIFDIYTNNLINLFIGEIYNINNLNLEYTSNCISMNFFKNLDLEFYLYQDENFSNYKKIVLCKLFPEFVPNYNLNLTNINMNEKNLSLFMNNGFDEYEENPILLFFSSYVYIDNFNLIKWISYLFDSIHFGFIIDNLSLLMLFVVLTISTLVHYYSIDYMSNDPWLITFLKYLSGFTAAMLVLITANNYVLMFMGWEGVGIFSYLLIGFWYTRTLALKASLKAVIVNKIGDISLLIAMGLILYFFGTSDFLKLKILVEYMIQNKISLIKISFFSFQFSLVSLICFFFFIAAVGKSAQFGLHTWLPDAMEGPTPVSALIHAATMVTAGVYLIVWTSFLFELSDFIRNMILIVGAFTALFGSVVACFQYDIKKIIAFSTCSQIGYMFLACGLSAYHVAMFHLFTHAFFKALLFLCAGSVIHSIADQQDIRKMGGLYKMLPITFAGISIGLFSLMGLPFTSGFYSKDCIIELAFSKNTFIGYYSFSCAILAALLTAFYCYRFFYYVFFSTTRMSWNLIQNAQESGKFILTVICILSFLTIFVGFLFKQPLSSPFSYIYYFSSIYIKSNNFIFSQNENFIFFLFLIKKIIFIIPILGFLISYLFFNIKFNSFFFYNIIEKKWIKFYIDIYSNYYFIYLFWYCLQAKGLIDYIYNKLIVKPLLNFSYVVCYIELDWGWFEYIFIKQVTLFLFWISKFLNQTFSNPTLMFLPAMLFIVIFFFVTIIFAIKFNLK